LIADVINYDKAAINYDKDVKTAILRAGLTAEPVILRNNVKRSLFDIENKQLVAKKSSDKSGLSRVN